MTKIKDYLTINYPEAEAKTLTDLYLADKDLTGELTLLDIEQNLPKLERVWVHPKLKIINDYDLTIARVLNQKTPTGISLQVPATVEVKTYIPIEERLEELYPTETRKHITKLDLTQKGLRGTLNLEDFEKLEELTINMDCPWGRKYAKSNYITGLNLPNTLIKLTLTNNPNSEWELGRLNALTNLEKLVLRGESEKYPAQWTGSLEELEDLEKLTELDISYNPNIKTGLESLKKIEKLECRGTVYEKPLKSFGGDILAWKVISFPKKVSDTDEKIFQTILICLTKTRQSLKELNQKGYTDTELESKIKILENKSDETILSV